MQFLNQKYYLIYLLELFYVTYSRVILLLRSEGIFVEFIYA